MLNPWPQGGRAVVGRGLTTPGSSSDACRQRLRVELTPWRTAAYGHRTFNVGFVAMNPKGRLSQSDPKQTFRFLQSSPTLGATSFQFYISEAAIRGSQLSGQKWSLVTCSEFSLDGLTTGLRRPAVDVRSEICHPSDAVGLAEGKVTARAVASRRAHSLPPCIAERRQPCCSVFLSIPDKE